MTDTPRIEDLRRRVQKDPASIAFAQLAEEYRRAGRIQESIDACRVGLARHPGYLSARITLGRALLELGEFDEAQRELEFVLKSAPETFAAIRSLAEIHRARGAFPDALIFYKAALALARNDPDLAQMVADLTRQVGPSSRPALRGVTPPPPLVVPLAVTAVTLESAPALTDRRDAPGRALRTVAALERWLEAVAANNVARTQPHA